MQKIFSQMGSNPVSRGARYTFMSMAGSAAI